jgi:chemotaxis protein CheX
MSATAQTEEIARRYGLEAVPENVRRLGQLVSRQDANTEEVAKLICKDSELTARILRAANPMAESEADYRITTVEAALQRSGLGSALFLAMQGPIVCAVGKTFSTMLGVGLKVRASVALPSWGEHVHCEISFKGKASGSAALRLAAPDALQIAARVLDMPAAELDDAATIDDVVGELCNMVVGNFKSNLCDAGLTCTLSTPAITRTSDRQLRAADGSLAERMAFHADGFDLLLDLNVNPWGE